MPRLTLMTVAAICFLTTSAFARDDESKQDAPVQLTPVSASPKLPLWEAGLFGLELTQPAYPGADDRVRGAHWVFRMLFTAAISCAPTEAAWVCAR
jgi:hypothetical protein